MTDFVISPRVVRCGRGPLMRRASPILLCALLHAWQAQAQPQTPPQTPSDGPPDPAVVRLTVGPLMVNPTISLTNFGIDNNVFDEPADQGPKKDLTLTVTPATNYWLRFGSTWISGAIREDIVWYQKYSSERSANTSYSLAWRVPLSALLLRARMTYLNTHDRPGFEIDARAPRSELGFDGTVELKVLSQTSIVANAARTRVSFDKDAVFLDTNLQLELSRVSSTYGGGLKYQVTALTAVSVTASRVEDRFEFSPLRDSNSTTGGVSVAFDPVALIKGSATFGYRSFEPVQPGLAAFKGVTANANLSYTLLDTTRFGFILNRDVQYSYDVTQPYYLMTSIEGSIAQQIFGPVDVVGRAGRQSLAYRDRAGVSVPAVDRTDLVHSYGGGVGYHFGRELRLGFNIDQYRRLSDVAQRQYDDLRIGSSLTYGF